MKKLLFILLSLLFVSPAFAQGGEAGKIGAEIIRGGTVGLTEKVALEAAKKSGILPRVFTLEFVNLPETFAAASAVESRLLVRQNEINQLGMLPDQNIVQAMAFPTRQLNRHMPEFDDLNLHALVAYRQESSLLRGMVLKTPQDLKNLLTNGMPIDRTRYDCIYATRYLSAALDYASNNAGYFPVIVQMPVTDEFSSRYLRGGSVDGVEFSLYRDVTPRHISKVMVFLKIGKPGWYDVTLQDEKLVFSRVPLGPENELPEEILPTNSEEVLK